MTEQIYQVFLITGWRTLLKKRLNLYNIFQIMDNDLITTKEQNQYIDIRNPCEKNIKKRKIFS